MCERYVSNEATGSGNGFGEMSGSAAPPRFGGGVRGTSSVALEVEDGSGVASRWKSSGAREAGLRAGSAGGEVAMWSQRPRMDASSVSVDLAARSVDENSTPLRSVATTRRTRFGATWPGCGARGDGAEAACGWEASAGDAIPTVKKPVTAPATHSCLKDIRSQNSSAEHFSSSPSGLCSLCSLCSLSPFVARSHSSVETLLLVYIPIIYRVYSYKGRNK